MRIESEEEAAFASASTAVPAARTTRSVTRQTLLVLGMHRSGTSAMAGLLVRLGAGGPKTLMPPDEHNPRGYWESNAFVPFHERLLEAAGSRWDSWTRLDLAAVANAAAAHGLDDEFRRLTRQEFGDAQLFVMKDPRISRIVPFWLDMLAAEGISPSVILTLRNPLEVAESLRKRDGFSREHSLLIWLRHMLDAEFATRQVCRSIVRYQELLVNWRAVAEKLSRDLAIEWPSRNVAIDADIDAFLDCKSCHHRFAAETLNSTGPLADWVTRAYTAFDMLVDRAGPDSNEALTALDDVRREFDHSTAVFGPVLERMSAGRHAQARVKSIQAELAAASIELSTLHTDRDRLRDKAGALETDRADLRSRIGRLEAEGNALRVLLDGVESEREELCTTLRGVESERHELWTRAEGLVFERSELVARVEGLEAERSDLLRRVEGLESERGELLTRLDGLESIRGELVGSISDLERAGEALRQSNLALERQVQGLKHDFAEVTRRVETMLASHTWRMTAPLRALWRFSRRIGSRLGLRTGTDDHDVR